MLNGIMNLALLTGLGLGGWLCAYYVYRGVMFAFVSARKNVRQVIEQIVWYDSTHLDPYAE